MLIYVLDILLVLLQVFGIQASGRYFTLNKTWFEASKECDMFMPNVKITSDRFVMDIKEQIDLDENGLWVGYFTMKTGFEYMGCFKKPRMTAEASSLLNTPGLCYTACNKASIIGISGYECFCLNGKLPRSNDTCNWSCRSHDWISCGGNDLLSVYRSNNEVTGKEPSAEGEKGNCLSFEYTEGKNKICTWNACSEYKLQLCYTTDQLTNGIDHGPWNVSVQHCLRPPSRPSYYKDLQDTTVQINPSWSGVIRSDVMYEYKDFKDSYANVWYGYVTTDSKTSQPILRFTKDGTDKRRAALCQNKGFVEIANDDQSSSKGVTVSTMTAIISVVVMTLIVAVLTVLLMKKRRTNQRTRLTEVGYVHEQTSYITPISDEAGDGASTTIQNNGTGEVGTKNSQNIVYESLGERNDEEHGYGAVNTQRSAYESLGDRHDKEHGYGTPIHIGVLMSLWVTDMIRNTGMEHQTHKGMLMSHWMKGMMRNTAMEHLPKQQADFISHQKRRKGGHTQLK